MSLWVVKVGTSLLRGDKETSTSEFIENLCFSIATCKKKGDKIVLVSSGAVGLGCHQLAIKNRPEDIICLQAVAAIGQGHLMTLYQKTMAKHGYKVAQILLTRADFHSRANYKSASMTLLKLLEWDILPVVNENDTLSSEELQYGDNDTLSALVATAIKADQLILLTDIDRLYSSDPRKDSAAQPITDVHNSNEIMELEKNSSTSGDWGTGGITTKLSAAEIATSSGITVHLANGRNPSTLGKLFKGSRGGTVFHPSPHPIKNRKSWLAHALKPLGKIFIDNGASDAIKKRGASLLLVGVKGIEGSFLSNQAVSVYNDNGEELARGLCSLGSRDIKLSLESPPLSDKSPVVIHRDFLVLTNKTIN